MFIIKFKAKYVSLILADIVNIMLETFFSDKKWSFRGLISEANNSRLRIYYMKSPGFFNSKSQGFYAEKYERLTATLPPPRRRTRRGRGRWRPTTMRRISSGSWRGARVRLEAIDSDRLWVAAQIQCERLGRLGEDFVGAAVAGG